MQAARFLATAPLIASIRSRSSGSLCFSRDGDGVGRLNPAHRGICQKRGPSSENQRPAWGYELGDDAGPVCAESGGRCVSCWNLSWVLCQGCADRGGSVHDAVRGSF